MCLRTWFYLFIYCVERGCADRARNEPVDYRFEYQPERGLLIHRTPLEARLIYSGGARGRTGHIENMSAPVWARRMQIRVIKITMEHTT